LKYNCKEAQDNYYISAKYLLELTNRAYELFKSSEVEERRQLIKLVLSNLRVEGKLVRYEAVKPFDTILNFADRQAWLRRLNAVRTFFLDQIVQPSSLILDTDRDKQNMPLLEASTWFSSAIKD
jgi:hypothetical protein